MLFEIPPNSAALLDEWAKIAAHMPVTMLKNGAIDVRHDATS